MKCASCAREVAFDAAFCPGCGQRVESRESKAPDAISAEWLGEVLSREGYEIEVQDDKVLCKRAGHLNFSLVIDREQRVLCGVAYFGVKGGLLSKGPLFNAVNEANQYAAVPKFLIDEDGDLMAMSFLPFVSSLADADVVELLRRSNDEINNAVARSGLLSRLE